MKYANMKYGLTKDLICRNENQKLHDRDSELVHSVHITTREYKRTVHQAGSSNEVRNICDFAYCAEKATLTVIVPISEDQNILLDFCSKCADIFNGNERGAA